MITSRERVNISLEHNEPDKIPLDLGGSLITGMHVSSIYKLRQAKQLDPPGTPVKVIDPYQMLGEIKQDLIDMLGIDTIPLVGSTTMFGYKKEGWKEWQLFDGTPVLVPALFNTDQEPNGDIFQYPEGDKTVSPSGRMSKGGWYFDAIERQKPIKSLQVEENLEEFPPIDEETLEYFKQEVDKLYYGSTKSIVAAFGGWTNFGDIAFVPAPWLKDPKGIRGIEEWYASLLTRQDYIVDLFNRQCENAISSLQKIFKVVDNKISVIILSGTDFGTQSGPFISPKLYRTLFKPFHSRVNQWIHANTKWKTFTHSCGSIYTLIPDFIEAGFDILNPVQFSAKLMDPKDLKHKFGKEITFWGGGIDTQRTLPFGTPEQVKNEVIKRIKILKKNGGFVFGAIHNIQPQVPVDNLITLFDTFNQYRGY